MIRPLSLLLLLTAPTALPAQTPPVLTRVEAGTCSRCTLKLEYVATIGSADDKELVKDFSNVLALRSGGFVTYGQGLMQLYDAKGKYLRTVGQLGEGPGEYKGIQAAASGRGDSVVVYSYGRITTISVATGKGRSNQSLTQQRAFRILSLPDGGTLAQNYNEAPGAFIVMAPDATVRKGFGPIAAQVQYPSGMKGPNYDAQQFAIAPSANGGFWAAKMNFNPSLQRWSEDGQVLQTIARTPSWFAPYTFETLTATNAKGMGVVRPLPRVSGLWVDAKDQLFLMATVADANWRPDPMAAAPQEAGKERSRAMRVPTGGYSRYIDGVIDVYDGKSGTLLGSWRSAEWPGMPIGEGMLALQNQGDDGVISYTVWRMVLSGR